MHYFLFNFLPEFADAWCAYSFGDREIVVRTLSDPMAGMLCAPVLV